LSYGHRAQGRARTADPRYVKAVLSQLSHPGISTLRCLDSNQDRRLNRPVGYQLPDTESSSADGTRTRNVSRVKAGRLSQFVHRAMRVPGGLRTPDPRLVEAVLSQLSYRNVADKSVP
jgi:hypothetical protein